MGRISRHSYRCCHVRKDGGAHLSWEVILDLCVCVLAEGVQRSPPSCMFVRNLFFSFIMLTSFRAYRHSLGRVSYTVFQWNTILTDNYPTIKSHICNTLYTHRHFPCRNPERNIPNASWSTVMIILDAKECHFPLSVMHICRRTQPSDIPEQTAYICSEPKNIKNVCSIRSTNVRPWNICEVKCWIWWDI